MRKIDLAEKWNSIANQLEKEASLKLFNLDSTGALIAQVKAKIYNECGSKLGITDFDEIP